MYPLSFGLPEMLFCMPGPEESLSQKKIPENFSLEHTVDPINVVQEKKTFTS